MAKINIIDVGCGQHLDEEWKKYKKSVDFFLGFDPSDKVDEVKKTFPDRVIYNCAVFDEEGHRPFYDCNYPRNSSLFLPDKDMVKKYVSLKTTTTYRQAHRFDIKEIREVKCIRLDTVISDLNINFDFLKIDTQGADYNVIKSLGKYLGTQIVGIKTESFLKPLYEGIKLSKDIDDILKNSGFERVKKMPISSNLTRKFVADFLYIRKDSSKLDKIKLIKKVYGVN